MAHVKTFVRPRSLSVVRLLSRSLFSSHSLINELMRNKNKINEVIVKIARVFLATNIISPIPPPLPPSQSRRSAHSRRNLKKESSDRNARNTFFFPYSNDR